MSNIWQILRLVSGQRARILRLETNPSTFSLKIDSRHEGYTISHLFD